MKPITNRQKATLPTPGVMTLASADRTGRYAALRGFLCNRSAVRSKESDGVGEGRVFLVGACSGIVLELLEAQN